MFGIFMAHCILHGEGYWRDDRVGLWGLAAALAWAVFAAGLADGVENLLLAWMIDIHAVGGTITGDALPQVAALLAWPKIAFLGVALV